MGSLDLTPPTADPIKLYRGDTSSLIFRIRDVTTGTIQDLTGVTALMQLRPYRQNDVLLYTFNLTINHVAGEITMTIDADDWESINWTSGIWDLQLTYPSGDVETIATGSISVVEDVSYV